MTEQFKREQRAPHIQRVVETAFNGRTWEERVEFMRALYAVLRPHLPPELSDLPVPQLTHRATEILDAYVQARDHLERVLRTF
jgi:hypothetical protein